MAWITVALSQLDPRIKMDDYMPLRSVMNRRWIRPYKCTSHVYGRKVDDGRGWQTLDTTFHDMPKHSRNVLSIFKPLVSWKHCQNFATAALCDTRRAGVPALGTRDHRCEY